MRAKNTLAPEQFKQALHAKGITITQWAKDHGYRREEVYRVLNGQSKALYGRAHEIAVALGLKQRAA
jgi:gp16 family phage-associated protein